MAAGHRTRATLADVAARAGVARGTASKALNGGGQLKPETRRKVLAAAEDLGFVASPLARGLVNGRSFAVGLLTSNTLGRFSIPVLQGADDALTSGQMVILLCDARADPVRERHYLRTLVARGVDGFIIAGHRTDPRPSVTALVDVPVVYAYSPSDDPADGSIIPDDVHGGRIATEHLIALGRRRICFVGGGEGFLASRRRLKGVEEALAAAGLELAAAPLFGRWHEVWGRQAATMLLDARREFDAVVCASDQIARGVLETLRDVGVAVPDEVAVIGFDNREDVVTASRPELTSIDLNLRRVGETAATRLVAMINGRDVAPGWEEIPCELSIRESTARTMTRSRSRAAPVGSAGNS
ncbi:MAG TPA: LacI family DNA-binding transcriptional regulator [Mycobacteriales bacterium]|nr:LacI family DNA-binding transcriptional regulator [Mycobacteriales bacterium]